MSDSNAPDRLEELKAKLEVSALTPGLIHEALKTIVDELLEMKNGLDGGEF
ncbi:MAG: hypothetical protein KA312_01630 [Sphingorhabdus sp.]|nr:hypothetical protein [Sphingorhabdus sp.]